VKKRAWSAKGRLSKLSQTESCPQKQITVDSKMFSAAAYEASGKMLYLRFRHSDGYRSSTFLPTIMRTSCLPSRREGCSSRKSAITSATTAWPGFRPSDWPSRRPSPDGYLAMLYNCREARSSA